jgi:methylaspartate mutase sigma subunit
MRALLTSLPSDSHTWNLCYLQLLLEDHGVEVVNLGSCVTFDLITEALGEVAPDLLVVSSVNGHGAIEGRELIGHLVARQEAETAPVIIGGKLTLDPGTQEVAARDLLRLGYSEVFTGDEAVPRFLHYLDRLRTRTEVGKHEHGLEEKDRDPRGSGSVRSHRA